MAQSKITFDQAVEMMLGWYHHMRVDHLLEDELLFEIEIRLIVIRDDPSFSQRRRSLRLNLKAEKEQQKVLDVTLDAEKVEDIGLCDHKYQQICEILRRGVISSKDKCKARLLHLSHRIFQMVKNCDPTVELAQRLRDLLVRCVTLLRDWFYTQSTAPAEEENETALPLGDLFAIKPAQPQLDDVQSELGDFLNNAPTDGAYDRNLILSLQARIRRLEDELALRDEQREFSKQTVTVGDSMQNNHPTFAPHLGAGGNRIVTDHTASAKPYTVPHSDVPNLANPYPAYTSQISTFNQIQPNSSVPNYFNNLPPPSQSWFHPIPQSIPPVGNNNAVPNPTAWPVNPVPALNPARTSLSGQSSHRTLPVSRWTLTKYDGEDQGLKLNEFLEVVQALSLAEHVSEAELFESAVHLFTGHALKWYMTMRTTGRLLNWQHLVMELKRTFMHPDLDPLIKMKIYQRRQQRNESFNEFYYEMERLFRTMSNQIPDYEKMQILLQNIRIDYKKQLTFLPINDLATLVAAGQKVDALNFSAYNKVFGTEKQTNAVTVSEPKPKAKKAEPPNIQTQPSQSNNRNRNKTPITQTETAPSAPNTSRAQHQANSFKNQPNRLPTLTALIDSHCPPPPNHCFNCGAYGHRFNACRLPRGVLCENCGFRGYPTNNCPYCIKNEMSARENRGSLHH